MEWTRQIDGYCERVDPSYWAEPVNAVTNAAFLIAAFVMWRRTRGARLPLANALVIVLVTITTVFYDLATAVVVGVIVSALEYAWTNASRIHAKTYDTPEGAKVYQIQGPLFFGSADGFRELFDVAADPSHVVIDFADSRVADQSALTAIEAVAQKYEAVGKKVQLRHLSRDCHRLLEKAGQLMVDSGDDPDYQVAVNYGVRTGILGGGH